MNETLVATLVRMLDETRTYHEQLKDQYGALQAKLAKEVQIGENLRGLLKAEQAKPKLDESGVLQPRCEGWAQDEADRRKPYVHRNRAVRYTAATEALKAQYADLKRRYDKRKSDSLLMAYGGTPKPDEKGVLQPRCEGAMQEEADRRAPYVKPKVTTIDYAMLETAVENSKINLVVPDLEKRVSELEDTLDEWRKRAINAEEWLCTEKSKTRKTKTIFAQVDKFLTELERSGTTGWVDQADWVDHISNFLEDFRDSEWRERGAHKEGSVLEQLIFLCGPFCPSVVGVVNMKTYRACIDALVDTEDGKRAAYGLAMETFPAGSLGYTIAWEALGKPGETKHDGRRPRT